MEKVCFRDPICTFALFILFFFSGVEPTGCKVGSPAPFTIETVAAGNGEVTVFVTDPDGHTDELPVTPNHDKLKTYSCVYHPMIPGDYKVIYRDSILILKTGD